MMYKGKYAIEYHESKRKLAQEQKAITIVLVILGVVAVVGYAWVLFR